MTQPQSDVVLVSMPWAPVSEPSLGLSILKGSLRNGGFSSRVFHFAPRLLHWMTVKTYEMIASSWGINDFIFTGILDPGFDSKQQDALLAYAERYETSGQYPHPRYTTMKDVYELVLKLRTDVAPEFVDECVDRIQNCSPKIVGFTCMFDQTLAAVAVSMKLKQRAPDLRIVLGGYALEGEPGATVAKAFPWIDSIVVGDGEEEIVEIARETFGRCSGKVFSCGRLRVAKRINIAESPDPEYDDWFADIEDLARERSVQITPEVLPIESSRGCWWGQVKHCVFCGIDEETLKYRYKPPGKTLAMLESLRTKHGDHTFRFSDYILPKAYYSDFLLELAARQRKFRLQCEVKANHPPERVRLLADAGFVEIQPGIESFSTAILKRMDKGVRAVDNASLLKAAYISGLVVNYNLLYGLPGDQTQDYEEMLAMVPRIYHLIPPISRTQTVITRFAPLQATPERFSLRRHSHHPCYDVLFSNAFLDVSGFDYEQFAYYFERNFQYPGELALLYSHVVIQVEHWKSLHRQRFVELSWTKTETGSLRIADSRFGEAEEYELTLASSFLYAVLDSRPIKVDEARKELRSEVSLLDAEFSEALAQLEEHRLIWRDGDVLLGLAIPAEIGERHRANQWPKKWHSIYI
jgi:ribosomal peptide maturation radical SAM protein 1